MSYLSVPASETQYGVVEIGDYINVIDGIISIPQSVDINANVIFSSVTAAEGNFSTNLYAAGNLVVTSVTPSAGTGINVSNIVSNGYAASFTVTNTGVTYLNAGSGISISGNTGNITISSFGADLINVIGVTANYTATITDEYIGVNSANAVTITLPASFDGRVYTIKDELGQGSGKITVQPQAGELVDGKVNYIIGVPNQSVSLVGRTGNWYII
jgi:hypothetical protein